MGRRPDRLADVPRRPPDEPGLDRRALRAPPLPAGDAAEFVAERLSVAPYRYQARVTLHAAAEAVRAQGGAIEPIDDRTCKYRAGDDDLHWLAMRVAMLGVDFEVHEPEELREHLVVLANRLRRAAS
jgi:predicted DNA-binding transcriptional regulator YafY